MTGTTQTVALTGTGVGVPTAGVTPASLTFASTTIGSTTSAQTVTVSNSGTGALSISSIVIGGANPGDFADTTTCWATLAIGANCTISVTFTPTAAGSRTANLHVVDNSGNTGSTQSVTLTGTGASSGGGGTPTAALSPSSLTFATQTDGTTSSAQTLTLRNSGTISLTIASVAVRGTNSSDFAQTNTCGTSLAAGESCTISVTFDPTTKGIRSASVVVTDNSLAVQLPWSARSSLTHLPRNGSLI